MGVTIWSKNREADCGYGGFMCLRQKSLTIIIATATRVDRTV